MEEEKEGEKVLWHHSIVVMFCTKQHSFGCIGLKIAFSWFTEINRICPSWEIDQKLVESDIGGRNASPATGPCHRGSWAGRSTSERCPTREAASPLLSCRTMASPCNQWAEKDRDNKGVSFCLCPDTRSAECIFKQSCRWNSNPKHSLGLTCPGKKNLETQPNGQRLQLSLLSLQATVVM